MRCSILPHLPRTEAQPWYPGDELAQYEPPEPEGRWRPVKHSLIVDLMHEELVRRDIQVTKEEYAIQREGNYLFAALTTNWLDTGETAAALAFRHANDKTEAMNMYAGVRVFICDNMALSGDEIVMNRKHTTRFSPTAELTKAFDRYRDGALVLQRNIEDMKNGMMTQTAIEATLFGLFIAGYSRPACSFPSRTASTARASVPTGHYSTPAPCTPRICLRTATSGHMPS
jgi:hypothetical protein